MESVTSSAIDSLNALLRSSIAAAETYGKAIRKIESHRGHLAVALRVIQRNHIGHAEHLRREIDRRGGAPDDSSGAWGLLARTIEGAASLLGEAAAVKALKEGERHALSAALEALTHVDGAIADYLNDKVLPVYVQHLELLDAIVQSRTPPSGLTEKEALS